MISKKQKWARERNFLIWRVKGLMTHQPALRKFFPDAKTQTDLNAIFTGLDKVLSRLKKMDEFAKYQRYLRDCGGKR